MREPRPTDILEAVEYVTGVDPLNKCRASQYVSARRLAVAALREICELSYAECAKVLGYADHKTVLHHARGTVDMRLLKAVLQRVSDRMDEEYASEQAKREEVAGWLR